MTGGLSILLPCRDTPCLPLARELARQAAALPGLEWELIVGDDASRDDAILSYNRAINRLPRCRVAERARHLGRAATRNELASLAAYPWLLLVDADMALRSPLYLARWADTMGRVHAQAVYGGYTLGPAPAGLGRNLRRLYEERHAATSARASRRARSPYAALRLCNLLVRRSTMLAHPLDPALRRYGHEDTLWAQELRLAAVPVGHTDNPLAFERFDTNPAYVEKVEQAARTLRGLLAAAPQGRTTPSHSPTPPRAPAPPRPAPTPHSPEATPAAPREAAPLPHPDPAALAALAQASPQLRALAAARRLGLLPLLRRLAPLCIPPLRRHLRGPAPRAALLAPYKLLLLCAPDPAASRR